jgi:xylono-1,5-lactonase
MQMDTVAFGYGVLEAPRVDDNGDLYFTDMFNGGVIRLSASGSQTSYLPDRKMIAGLALNEDGGLVLAGEGVIYFHPETGATRTLLDELDGIPSVQDIEPDASGSVWGATFDLAGIMRAANRGTEETAPSNRIKDLSHATRVLGAVEAGEIQGGSIFRIDPPGEVHTLATGVMTPNGMAFSPDGTILYHNETYFGTFAWDVLPDRTITNKRLFAKVPEGGHNGLVVDAEGAVWVVAVGGGAVHRFTADGSLERSLEVPAKVVMSLEFGGADLRDLYIVTGTNDEDPARGGTVFRVRTDVPGLPIPKTKF